MTQSLLFEHLSEVCDVLRHLSRSSPDGPCWCGAELGDASPSRLHSSACVRARTALHGAEPGIAVAPEAPGYQFGV